MTPSIQELTQTWVLCYFEVDFARQEFPKLNPWELSEYREFMKLSHELHPLFSAAREWHAQYLLDPGYALISLGRFFPTVSPKFWQFAYREIARTFVN